MNKKSIGLIGCSQLSLYLAQAARHLGHHIIGLSDKKNDPAVIWCNEWIKGKSNHINDIKKIAAVTDFLIFEDKMHFSDDLLQSKKIFCKPSSLHLNQLSDLWTLKELLYDFSIPQMSFMKMNGSDDFDTAFNFFKSQVVFKKRFSEKSKIDTFQVKNKIQLKKIKNDNKGYEGLFLAEPLIPFLSEHRLIIARNKNDQFSNYPLLILDQKNNQYNSVSTQILNPLLNKKIESILKKIKKMMSQIDYQGLLTISLFKSNNNFLIFDIDSRPTNTGVITMMGFNVNQFDLHLISLLNLELPQIQQTAEKLTCQYIISGQKRNNLISKLNSKKIKTSQIFLYGKIGKRKDRKLGHMIYAN